MEFTGLKLRVPPDDMKWSCYTDEANLAVNKVIQRTVSRLLDLKAKEKDTDASLSVGNRIVIIEDAVIAISEARKVHAEIGDTAVREEISSALGRILLASGVSAEIASELLGIRVTDPRASSLSNAL